MAPTLTPLPGRVSASAPVETSPMETSPIRPEPGAGGAAGLAAGAPGLAAGAPAPKPQASRVAPTVRIGSPHYETVTTIQYLLRHHGQELEVDGNFEPATEQAVRDFQGKTTGLTVDGIVGPRTWDKLFVTVELGSDAVYAVSAVQSQLAAWGMDVAVDGTFGSQTEQAIRDFQEAHELTADGVVGPQTWAALVTPD